MPAVISKFLSAAADNCERRGHNLEIFSKTMLSTALVAYVVKLSYPHIKEKLKGTKISSKQNGTCANNNNNNIYDKTQSNGKAGNPIEPKDVKLKIIEKKLKQPGLNLDFIMQLKKLVQIMVPKLVCRCDAFSHEFKKILNNYKFISCGNYTFF